MSPASSRARDSAPPAGTISCTNPNSKARRTLIRIPVSSMYNALPKPMILGNRCVPPST